MMILGKLQIFKGGCERSLKKERELTQYSQTEARRVK